MGEIPGFALVGGCGPYIAAGLNDGAFAGGGCAPALDELGDIHGPGADRGPVAGDGNIDRVRGFLSEVQQVDTGSVLEDDFAFSIVAGSDGRPLDVVICEAGDLFTFFRAGVVRPDVQAMLIAAIGHVVHLASVPHGLGVGAFPVGDFL